MGTFVTVNVKRLVNSYFGHVEGEDDKNNETTPEPAGLSAQCELSREVNLTKNTSVSENNPEPVVLNNQFQRTPEVDLTSCISASENDPEPVGHNEQCQGSCEVDSPSNTSASKDNPSPSAPVRESADSLTGTKETTAIACLENSIEQILDYFINPCQNICKFPNINNNCWMNGTLHAMLNLEVLQNSLRYQNSEFFENISCTPVFAGLFLTALKNPGKTFTEEEMIMVMKDLSKLPSLRLFQTNDALDLLNPLLQWLENCGVKTSIKVTEEMCEKCFSEPRLLDLGRILFLTASAKYDTVSSLIRSALGESQDSEKCTCGGTKRKNIYNAPDIFSISLSRPVKSGKVFREPVIPSKFVEIPVGENRKQVYKLSSVICHTGSAASGHIWSYLFGHDVIIKADGRRISPLACRLDDISDQASIYIYEKMRIE